MVRLKVGTAGCGVHAVSAHFHVSSTGASLGLISHFSLSPEADARAGTHCSAQEAGWETALVRLSVSGHWQLKLIFFATARQSAHGLC